MQYGEELAISFLSFLRANIEEIPYIERVFYMAEIGTYIECATVNYKKEYNGFDEKQFDTSNSFLYTIYKKYIEHVTDSKFSLLKRELVLLTVSVRNVSRTHPMSSHLGMNIVPKLRQLFMQSLNQNIKWKSLNETDSSRS